MIVVDLPVDEPDPVSRLEIIHAITSELKSSGLVDGAQTIIELADSITPFATPLTRLRHAAHPDEPGDHQHPRPADPAVPAAAPGAATYPYVEVIDHEGLTIAVVSYEDQLFFGITTDRDVVPDLGRLCALLEEAVGEFEPSTG